MRIRFIQFAIDILRSKKKINIKSYFNCLLAIFYYHSTKQKKYNLNNFKIILKFDDLENNNFKIIKLDKFIKKSCIKACWGIIGNSLENPNNSYIEFIKNNYQKNYDFFNHGYKHSGTEFYDKTIQEQEKNIKKTQDIVLEKTGIRLNSFGAPCNKIDTNTKTALENVDIKYWFYGTQDYNYKNIVRTINIENGVGNPDFIYFIKQLETYNYKTNILTLQAHPNMWNRAHFLQFQLIIKFLKKENCKFIFPNEIQ